MYSDNPVKGTEDKPRCSEAVRPPQRQQTDTQGLPDHKVGGPG